MRTAVTIGTFDGVHLGHRKVLGILLQKSRELGLTPAAIVFRHPPKKFFGHDVSLLMTPETRIRTLKELGIKKVLVLDFLHVKDMQADEFIEKFLVRKLGCKLFVACPRFRFGRDRSGDMKLLKSISRRHGFGVLSVSMQSFSGTRISSSMIRRAIAEGDMKKAASLMGSPFLLEGSMVKGHGVGKDLGYPTINLSPAPYLAVPMQGIYAAVLIHKKKRYPGAMYIGTRPTFGGTGQSFEIHLFSRPPAVKIGGTVSLAVLKRVRSDESFTSPSELSKAIASDVQAIKAFFQSGIDEHSA